MKEKKNKAKGKRNDIQSEIKPNKKTKGNL